MATFPIRSTTEINLIINKGQNALGDIGLEIIQAAKRGDDVNDRSFRDLMYRLILLRIYLQNILDDDGNIIAYYNSSSNEKKFNRILDAIARLANTYSGAAIPLLTGKRIPLYYYPSVGGISQGGGGGGSGEATPGGTTFGPVTIDAPSGVVDQFDASSATFAFYLYSAYGVNSGEGSRSGILIVTIRNGQATLSEPRSPELSGITSPITFDVAVSGGQLQLTATTSTNGWIVKGVRILFQNITFQNPLAPMPAGGTINQVVMKLSSTDYDFAWTTILQSHVSGLVGALAAIQADADAAQAAADTAQSDIDTHEARTDNPHSVTKTQVGLGNVDNTSDANKPISSAVQTALDEKVTGGSLSWTGFTYQNSWANTSGLTPGGYTKDGLEFVHLRGQATGGGASADTIATLPVGFRPTQIFLVYVTANFGGILSTEALTINTNGTIVADRTAGSYSLDNISFPTT